MNHSPALGMLLEPLWAAIPRVTMKVCSKELVSIAAALDRSRNVPSDRSRDAAVSREVVVERRRG
jgi:hypothetical protein